MIKNIEFWQLHWLYMPFTSRCLIYKRYFYYYFIYMYTGTVHVYHTGISYYILDTSIFFQTF